MSFSLFIGARRENTRRARLQKNGSSYIYTIWSQNARLDNNDRIFNNATATYTKAGSVDIDEREY